MVENTATSKPGVKTSEFWSSLVTKILGALLAAYGAYAGKEVLIYIGAGLLGSSDVAYTIARGLTKARAVPILLVSLALLLPGCTKGTVRASELLPSFRDVRARHDAYVLKDESLNPTERRIYLRDTELIHRILEEAASDGEATDE